MDTDPAGADVAHTVGAEGFRADSMAIQADPFAFYGALRRQRPVLESSFFGQPCWVVSRYDDISAVLMNPRLFSSRTTPIPVLLFTDPPDHERLRRMLADRFTASAVKLLEAGVAAQAERRVDAVVAKGGCDIVADLAGPLTAAMIAQLLGIDEAEVLRLRSLAERQAAFVSALRTGTEPDEAARNANAEIGGFVGGIFERRDFSESGIVALLAEHEAAGELSRAEAIGTTVLLYVAGHSTTTQLVANAVHILVQRPDLLARLAEHPARLAAFIEEVLRMRGSFQRILRIATRETELGGVTIPAGAIVRLLLGSANRDPHIFEDAESFDADAKRRNHMSFGRGIHSCLGSWLARLEATVVLRLLVERVRSISSNPAAPAVPLTGGTFNEFGFERLPVLLVPR